MKHKVAISVDPVVLRQVDGLVAKGSFRSRSHAMEALLAQSLRAQTTGAALILAGGLGTRLRPFTYEIPKPLIPIKDKPILQWQVDMLKQYGIPSIFSSIGYKAEKVRAGITGSKFIEEKEPAGTGGAVALALPHLPAETFLVMNGDILFEAFPDVAELYAFHKDQGCLATLVLLPAENRAQGVVKMAGNKIVSFLEKPENVAFGLISAGVYLFEPGIAPYLKPQCSLEREVFPKLAAEGKLAGYVFESKLYDIGTPEGYEQVLKEWTPYLLP